MLCKKIILVAEGRKEWIQLMRQVVGAYMKMMIVRTKRNGYIKEVFLELSSMSHN